MNENNNDIDVLLSNINSEIKKDKNDNTNNYELKKRRKPVKITLTDEQKKKTLEFWESRPENPPSLKEITNHIFGGEFDGRSMEASVIKGFLSQININPRTNFEYQKVQAAPLTEEQKEYITNHCSTMSAFEMAKELYPNRKIYPVGAETRQVNEYMRSLPDIVLYQRKNDLPEFNDYHPPKNLTQSATRVNKYILNCIKPEDIENNSKIKLCLQSLIRFCHMHRFVMTYESYENKSDRELFEGSYVRYVWSKEDLQEEELDLYVNLCTDIVNLTNMQKELNDLIGMRTQCAEDSEGKRLSLSIVQSIADVREDMNETKKRIKNAIEALQGKRNERITLKLQGTVSVISLVEAWQEEKERRRLLKFADERKKLCKQEIEKLDTMETFTGEIFGLDKESFE